MQLVTYLYQNRVRLGARVEDSILDLNLAFSDLPSEMIQFLNLGNRGLQLASQAIRSANKNSFISQANVKFLSPVLQPGKILCIGHNYAGHIGIGKTELPVYPNMFCKTGNTIIGHQQSVILPQVSKQVDYEGELAVIIGKTCKNTPEATAMDYIGGYSIFNDVSARDFQKRTSQWFTGKSFDTFGPLGPALVTPDEIPDPHCLELELRVNGVPKQRGNTRDLIFHVPYLIAYLSRVMTLEPGDVIATGTPAKLPDAGNPHVFLKSGDVVEVTIESLGTLSNPIL